jgi:hypothetical protein
MALSSLGSATHDRSLGLSLSVSTLRYSHLRELWRPTLAPPFHETPRSDVDFSPLVLATSRLREFQCQAPMHLSRESTKSRITLSSGPTAQLSPFTTVACGTFMRVHVAFNDVIGSHLSRFSLHPTGTWYFAMCLRGSPPLTRPQSYLLSGFQTFQSRNTNVLRVRDSPNPDMLFLRYTRTVDHSMVQPSIGVSDFPMLRHIRPQGSRFPEPRFSMDDSSIGTFPDCLDYCHASTMNGRSRFNLGTSPGAR